jgi:hypothetical protein
MTGEPATREATIEAFVARSKRRTALGIRQSFLQAGRGPRAGAGVLANFVRRRDRLALGLYLLLLLLGRGARFGGHTVEVQAGTWSRALGLEGRSRNQVLSRAVKRLEELKLIQRTKTRKGVRVEILKEDGSGSKYTPPSGAEPYFQLPLEYWLSDHYLTLGMPGTAMLLIALGEREEFELPVAVVPAYYGISAETADRGFEELVRASLIAFDRHWVTDAMDPDGRRMAKRWQLQEPYLRERSERRGIRANQPRLTRVK